jgi:hypothetical protein
MARVMDRPTETPDHRAPRIDVPQLITLLVHLSRALDRLEGADDALLELALRAVAMRLNIFSVAAGAPDGDDEAAFRRWPYDCWPSPAIA